MITIVENAGYLYNIRVNTMLKFIPEIERIDIYKCSEKNILFRLYRKMMRTLGLYNVVNKYLINAKVRRINGRFPLLISFSYNFCRDYPGNIIVDIDDPYFSFEEIEIINSENVKALVVTTNYIAKIYKDKFKVTKPIYVIPTGIDLKLKCKEGGCREKFIIGYYSAMISNEEIDRIVDIAEKLDRYEDIEVWIIGRVSKLVERENVKCFGYLLHDQMIKKVREFDVGLYVRTNDLYGRLSVKLVEMMAMGIPIVSTNVTESFCVSDGRAGIVTQVNNLHSAAEKMYLDSNFRLLCSKNARVYAKQYGKSVVAQKYRNLINTYK